MRTSRSARSLAAALAAAFSLVALGAAPALAASPATISVHVVDSVTGDPVTNITVYASEETGNGFVDFGATDLNGNLTHPAGGYEGSDRFTSGRWDFSFTDSSDARYEADTPYVDAQRENITVHAGANDLGEEPLDAGGIVSGTARTPSGHLLPGLGYEIDAQSSDDGDFFATGGFTESGDATYESGGLPTGTFDVLYDPNPDDFAGPGSVPFRPATTFEVTEPGQRVTADLSVRVAATPAATTLVGSSPGKGTASLVFKIANTYYGISDPHGVVTFMSAAGKTIGEPVPVTEVNGHGKATITFPATSTSHTYRAYYSTSPDNVADLRSISRTTTLRVR